MMSKQSADRKQANAKRIPTGNRVAVERELVHFGGRFDQANVIGFVNKLQFAASRGPGRYKSEFSRIEFSRNIEQSLYALSALRVPLSRKVFQVILIDNHGALSHRGKG